ncbi:MAG TPA: LytR C-terminal domain-containing protein [Gemmatimonadales bacterium]|nr:LytR C-terminal domain-containing protein [Gemmatimonadales bacterium]
MRRSALSLALALLAGSSAGCGEEATPQGSAAGPEGKRVLVEVLNGSGRRGLARAATRVLRRAGFDVVYFGTVRETGAPTVALARRGDSAAAVRVARVLGASAVRVATDTLLRLDVTVILGNDYRAPPGLRP